MKILPIRTDDKRTHFYDKSLCYEDNCEAKAEYMVEIRTMQICLCKNCLKKLSEQIYVVH